MNTSRLIISFSCGKVNFSRSILLFKRGFYMSEDMEVACLLCLSDDKSFPETFWAICQMTNRPQRRFGTSGPSTLRKMTIWAHLHSGVFAWKGIFMDCHADARNDGCEVTGLPRFARNDGYEVTGLPRFARNDGCEVTGLPRWCLRWWAWYMSLQKFFFQNFLWRQFVKSFFPCSRIKDCICGAKRYG